VRLLSQRTLGASTIFADSYFVVASMLFQRNICHLAKQCTTYVNTADSLGQMIDMDDNRAIRMYFLLMNFWVFGHCRNPVKLKACTMQAFQITRKPREFKEKTGAILDDPLISDLPSPELSHEDVLA
jgi:hypothetical protein